jgi:hypothetical protein
MVTEAAWVLPTEPKTRITKTAASLHPVETNVAGLMARLISKTLAFLVA